MTSDYRCQSQWTVARHKKYNIHRLALLAFPLITDFATLILELYFTYYCSSRSPVLKQSLASYTSYYHDYFFATNMPAAHSFSVFPPKKSTSSAWTWKTIYNNYLDHNWSGIRVIFCFLFSWKEINNISLCFLFNV